MPEQAYEERVNEAQAAHSAKGHKICQWVPISAMGMLEIGY